MSKPIIIGLAGKKQSGKGSACKFLTDNAEALFSREDRKFFASVKINTFPMAGPLKRLCIEVLGLSPEQVYGTEEQKNSLTRYRWEDMPHYQDIRSKAWAASQAKFLKLSFPSEKIWEQIDKDFKETLPTGSMTARQILQQAGTGIFRTMHDNVWVEAWQREVLSSGVDVALCDDVRFPNEVEGIKAIGGGVYRLTRDVYEGKDQHESELALDYDRYPWKNFNGVIDNKHLSVRETNRLLLLSLYKDGFIPNAVKLCECCDGLSPDDLDYGEAA